MQVRKWFVCSVFNLSLSPAQFITNPAGFELQVVMYQEKCLVGYRSYRVRNVKERVCSGAELQLRLMFLLPFSKEVLVVAQHFKWEKFGAGVDRETRFTGDEVVHIAACYLNWRQQWG